MTTVKINVNNLQWLWKEDPASKQYVAVCRPLNLTAAGETMQDLCKDMSEAIQDLFVDLLTSNDLDSFLQRQGWNHAPIALGTNPAKVRFDVPFDLIREQMENSRRAHA
jgi:predicted RNase H-like HicB family nuclease